MGGDRVPGPLGAGGALVVSPEPTGSSPQQSLDAFKRAVIQLQIEHLLRKGRQFIAALPASELEVVEGHEALETAKSEGDEGARQTADVVIHSAYRDFNEDASAWERSFRKQYRKMLKKKQHAADRSAPPPCVTSRTR
jgi:DnaJ-domain-containing protein 1